MRYVISDIHGCYEEYKALLDKIRFSDDDILYVLGDVVDRGEEPVKVLEDMMARPNVVFLLGNHDFMMFHILNKLAVEITEDNYDKTVDMNDLMAYQDWIMNGGNNTAEQFRKLSRTEQRNILDYIADGEVYTVLKNGCSEYVLVHAGLGNYQKDKDLEEYELYELIDSRADYNMNYFPDEENKFLVTGHTPTRMIEGWGKDEVYMKNNHIALDCGCVFGGQLAAYCIETGEVIYERNQSSYF